MFTLKSTHFHLPLKTGALLYCWCGGGFGEGYDDVMLLLLLSLKHGYLPAG